MTRLTQKNYNIHHKDQRYHKQLLRMHFHICHLIEVPLERQMLPQLLLYSQRRIQYHSVQQCFHTTRKPTNSLDLLIGENVAGRRTEQHVPQPCQQSQHVQFNNSTYSVESALWIAGIIAWLFWATGTIWRICISTSGQLIRGRRSEGKRIEVIEGRNASISTTSVS